MASPTKKHKVRKAITKAKKGKERKNRLANAGSTAKNLPLNMPNANEKKQKQSQSSAKAAAAKA